MTETELKPCPFCGYALSYDEGICPAKEVEDDEDETDVGIGGICCPSCAVWLPLDKPTPAEAIAAWNRRTPSREAIAAIRSSVEALGQHVSVEYDGFAGTIIGSYTTREGKRGWVVQQDGTRVVHVYGESRVTPTPKENDNA